MAARAGSVVLDASGAGDYTDILSAYTGTSSGDTIYVVASTSSYGSFTASSPRVIIGEGNDTTKPKYSQFGNITLNTGAQGSKFYSIYLFTISTSVNNVDFVRCKIAGNTHFNAALTGINFNQCYISNTITVSSTAQVSFKNSIFRTPTPFYNALAGGSVNVGVERCTIYQGRLSATNVDYKNCVVNSNKSTAPVGITTGSNGNKIDTEANLKFDADLKLQATSTALGVAMDGSQSGAYGGSSPYLVGGTPPVPVIELVDNNAYSVSGSNLSIRVKAKSQN